MESTIDDELLKVQQALDVFEASHNLSSPTLNNEVDDILNMSHAQIEKLDPEQCAEYGYLLVQYAYYLQRIVNKESATLKWIRDQIEKVVAAKWSSYDSFTRYEIRPRLIAKENAVMDKLLKKASYYEQKIERLSFLGMSINRMADKLENLQRVKQR